MKKKNDDSGDSVPADSAAPEATTAQEAGTGPDASTALDASDAPPASDGVELFCFQAEDGIRDYKVTGVQTCALPIFRLVGRVANLLPDEAEAPRIVKADA